MALAFVLGIVQRAFRAVSAMAVPGVLKAVLGNCACPLTDKHAARKMTDVSVATQCMLAADREFGIRG